MADRHAITDLFNEYAYANDIADASLTEGMFTRQSAFALTIAGAPAVGPFEDRDTMLDFFREAFSAQTDEQRRHATTNLRFTQESDDRAEVEAYLVLTTTKDGAARLVCTGVYETTVVLHEGRWQFERMTIALDSGF